MEDWRAVRTLLHEALPEIDKALSQANVPISGRKLKAFELVRDTMLDVDDYEAFFRSEAHGRFHIIIGDWYRARYGAATEANNDTGFGAMVMIHDTPFALTVPKIFKEPAEEPDMVWIGFPASVQAEEDALKWIENQAVIEGLSADERDDVKRATTETGNLVRSIGFDLRGLAGEPDEDIADLAGAIMSDLQASARHLCEQTKAGLRSAAWDASQATEKALKLFVRRSGQTPPHTHDLQQLSNLAESLGSPPLDRSMLAAIPSSGDATGLRYGGPITLSAAVEAYGATLPIVRDLVLEATPDTEYNLRETRFKIKRPPWFEFDIGAFRDELRSMPSQSDKKHGERLDD